MSTRTAAFEVTASGALEQPHLLRLPAFQPRNWLRHSRGAADPGVCQGYKWVDLVLFFEPPSADPQKAGAGPAILATLYLGILLLVFTVPLGVGTAIYLEEYADKNRWYNRLLEVNIQNLAAVPSIVYGILGLAFLVRGIGLGRVLLAGGMILTLLVLPTVIIAAREAIRAVPDSIRQGAYALGATKWQVVWRQVLPGAIPGIATGSILALSRGSARPRRCFSSARLPTSRSTRRCWARSRRCRCRSTSGSRDRRTEFRALAAAAIIVLLGDAPDAERFRDLAP